MGHVICQMKLILALALTWDRDVKAMRSQTEPANDSDRAFGYLAQFQPGPYFRKCLSKRPSICRFILCCVGCRCLHSDVETVSVSAEVC